MKHLLVLTILIVTLSSCGGSKNTTEIAEKEIPYSISTQVRFKGTTESQNGVEVSVSDSTIVVTNILRNTHNSFQVVSRELDSILLNVNYVAQKNGQKIFLNIKENETAVDGQNFSFELQYEQKELKPLNGTGHYSLVEWMCGKSFLQSFYETQVAWIDGEVTPNMNLICTTNKVHIIIGCNHLKSDFVVFESQIYFKNKFVTGIKYCENVVDLENKITGNLGGNRFFIGETKKEKILLDQNGKVAFKFNK